jgi:hypothetical protein
MTEMTMDQAELYLDQVEDALGAAGILPDDFRVSDADEYAEDGITTVPSAVLTWTTSDLLMVGPEHDRLEDGLLVAWSAEGGWQIAELNADRSNGPLEPLPMPVLAPPARVAITIASAVLGQPLTADGEPDGPAWSWAPARWPAAE